MKRQTKRDLDILLEPKMEYEYGMVRLFDITVPLGQLLLKTYPKHRTKHITLTEILVLFRRAAS